MAKSILGAFKDNDINQYGFDNQIINVHYEKIKSASNNRKMRNIEELAEDISEDGLESNLLVRKIEDSDYEYELVAGDRRFHAILLNINNGDMTYEYIPCKVVTLNDLDARKRLILNNFNADPFSEHEKLEKIAELKEIYQQKKAAGEKIPGRIQNMIATDVGLKKSQVGNYEKILNNATPEVRNLIEKGDITISAAAELSSMENEEQMMFVKENDNYDIKTIKEYRDSSINDVTNDESNPFADISNEIREDEPIFDEPIQGNEKAQTVIHKRTIKECMLSLTQALQETEERLTGVEFREESEQLQRVGKELEQLLLMMNLEDLIL